MSRILRKIGWSLQKPVVRAFQRREEAVEEWKQRDWPAHKKAEDQESTLVFVDETGLYPIPSVIHTYALRGQTPVLQGLVTRDHLSIIGAVTSEG